MKRSMTTAIVLSVLVISAGAYARGHKQPCQYSDLYALGCEQDLVRFLQRLDLTAGQKSAIDALYSAAQQQPGGIPQHGGVTSLDPADPDYHQRAAELADTKGLHVQQRVIRAAALQAQVYELLTPPQRAAYKKLRNDWAQGRIDQQPRRRDKRSRPTARNWASTSIRF